MTPNNVRYQPEFKINKNKINFTGTPQGTKDLNYPENDQVSKRKKAKNQTMNYSKFSPYLQTLII